MDEVIGHSIGKTLDGLPLRNVDVDAGGKCVLKEGVMDYEAEIRNVLEALVISDYFFDRDFEEIWKMGLDAVVDRDFI